MELQKPIWTTTVLTAAVLLGSACHESSSGGGSGGGAGLLAIELAVPTVPQLGDPLPDLTDDELAAFQRGKVIFEKSFKPSEGLGPLYNATSCASCHSTPVTGGSSQLYRNFYIAVSDFLSIFQVPLAELPSIVVPAYGMPPHLSGTFTLEGGRRVIPEVTPGGLPVIVAQRNGLPIFGVGLFEFVSNVTICANADPDDLDGDGISGRFNTDLGEIGRFGTKAQANNIELFTRPPLQNQMGITSDPFLGAGGTVSLSHAAVLQGTGGPNDPTLDNDGVPDPEISTPDLGDLIAFTRFLAPPAPKEFTQAATRGEVLFEQIGCTSCHIPELPSSRGPVRAYTDLLLHDMGPDLADGIRFGLPQSSSISPFHNESEFRTQPLWGVSLHAPFLHDGRAETLEEAVQLHGGETRTTLVRFRALLQAERDNIIEFLEHL